MADIQPYVRTLYLRNMPKGGGMSAAFVRRDEVIEKLMAQMLAYLAEYEVSHRIDVLPIVDRLFSEMLGASCFAELADDFAGKYYQPVPDQIVAFRKGAMSGDPISDRADAIGEQRYFGDVFGSFIGGETEEPLASGLGLPIPASDRVVTISHNQQAAVEPPLATLIDDVRSDNEALPDGVKERLLGQLRAGQELIRSGSVRAYLLYHTLIRGLMELVARYRGRAIAVAAERLVELLVEHIFQGTA